MKRDFWIGLFVGIVGCVALLALVNNVGAQSSPIIRSAGSGDQVIRSLDPQSPAGDAFTYQGQLKLNGNPISATCDIAFSLYDDQAAGIKVAGPVTNTGVAVSSGMFTTKINFGGSIFNGTAYWLKLAVKCPPDSTYTDLSPRQELTPNPYSLYAKSTGALQGRSVLTTAPATGNVLKWNGLSWQPDIDSINIYTAGTGLVNVSPNTFSLTPTYRLPQGCLNDKLPKWNDTLKLWQCADDANTTYSAGTGLKQISTTFSITPSYQLPQSCLNNKVAKWNDTSHVWECADDNVGSGALAWLLDGNTGINSAFNFVGTTDDQTLNFRANNLRALQIVPNAISPNLIGGYNGNDITADVSGAFIGGGGQNSSTNKVTDSFGVVVGGDDNIAGNNDITTTNTPYATIGGGSNNRALSDYANIDGGLSNRAAGDYSTIGGGLQNVVSGTDSTVAGGYLNVASGLDSSVGGGYLNQATGNQSTIPGGNTNLALGASSFAAGYQAQAINDGSFVWSDTSGGPLASTTNNQFMARAAGGFNLYGGSVFMYNISSGSYAQAAYGPYGLEGYSSAIVGGTGVYGSSAGSGYGVYGKDSTSTGYGVYGSNDGAGVGVAGVATGAGVGVIGGTASGVGVRGYTTSTTGLNWGVYGQSNSINGVGVYGVTDNTGGTAYGVYGSTSSNAGAGVKAQGSGTSGNALEIYNGGIKVTGAQTGYTTTTPVFVQAWIDTGPNNLACNGNKAIRLSNTYINGNPNAILFITESGISGSGFNWDSDGRGAWYLQYLTSASGDCPGGYWYIYVQSGDPAINNEGLQFNVMVIKP